MGEGIHILYIEGQNAYKATKKVWNFVKNHLHFLNG